MDLAHFSMLIHDFFNKDTDLVPEEAPLIVLDSKSDTCIADNGKDNKHTRHIARRMHCVGKGEKFNIHKNNWFEEGLQLLYTSTNSVMSMI